MNSQCCADKVRKNEKANDDVGVQRALGSAYDPHGNLESCSLWPCPRAPSKKKRKLKVNSIEQSVGIIFPLACTTYSSPQISLQKFISVEGICNRDTILALEFKHFFIDRWVRAYLPRGLLLLYNKYSLTSGVRVSGPNEVHELR